MTDRLTRSILLGNFFQSKTLIGDRKITCTSIGFLFLAEQMFLHGKTSVDFEGRWSMTF